MDVLRRTIVLGGLLSPLVAMPRFSSGFAVDEKALFVVLDGIDTALSPQLAGQVLETFFSNGISVSAIIQCPEDENDASGNEFVRFFKGISTKERGLFEAILAVNPTDERERYLQLREAIELRDCLEGASAENIAELATMPIVSLLNRGSKELWNPYALRAAGFRIQMRQDQDADNQLQNTKPAFSAFDWGIGLMMAGADTLIESDPETELKQLERLDGERVLYLSFRNAASIDSEKLLAHCSAWAARLNAEMLGGNIFPTRPMDYLLQGHPGVSKYVGLLLDLTEPPGPSDQILEFAESLEQAGFPYSVLVPDESSPTPAMAEKCIINLNGIDTGHESSPRCVLWDPESSELYAQSAEIVLVRTEDRNIWSGPRSDGRYHAAIQTKEAINFLRNMEEDPLTDMIFVVGSKQVGTRIQREALLEQFEQARSDDRANFFSVRGYLNQTVAPDPVLERFWSTRRRQISDPPVIKSINASDEEKFLDDARLAWRYIERHSDETTGICAGTVQTGLSSIVNFEVTFWDVASQIHGIISANALSIISDEEARNRVERIFDHMPTNKVDGLSLPPARFQSNTSRVTSRGFDSDDTGRFLISLRKVVDVGLATKERALAVLDQWEIASTVRNQRAFSYTDGAWVDVTMSHGSHYSRNGYIAWGIPMDTAYPSLSETDTGDQYIRLLYQAAFLGHFGTEPHLLEGIEVGHSPESKYLSDVLFDAQLSWFEETGQFKCVSEVALNFSPWFSYQGLRVDRSGADAWVIWTDNQSYSYRTQEFLRKADVISSKAAFLWAALYPHEYSSRLIELIREKARIEDLGFSIGVFNNTQEAMEGYSDVNTNGIILTAIAKKLGKL